MQRSAYLCLRGDDYPPPGIFVSAHSKGVKSAKFVSAHSKGLNFRKTLKCSL